MTKLQQKEQKNYGILKEIIREKPKSQPVQNSRDDWQNRPESNFFMTKEIKNKKSLK